MPHVDEWKRTACILCECDEEVDQRAMRLLRLALRLAVAVDDQRGAFANRESMLADLSRRQLDDFAIEIAQALRVLTGDIQDKLSHLHGLLLSRDDSSLQEPY
jgi:hypothetical protein